MHKNAIILSLLVFVFESSAASLSPDRKLSDYFMRPRSNAYDEVSPDVWLTKKAQKSTPDSGVSELSEGSFDPEVYKICKGISQNLGTDWDDEVSSPVISPAVSPVARKSSSPLKSARATSPFSTKMPGDAIIPAPLTSRSLSSSPLFVHLQSASSLKAASATSDDLDSLQSILGRKLDRLKSLKPVICSDAFSSFDKNPGHEKFSSSSSSSSLPENHIPFSRKRSCSDGSGDQSKKRSLFHELGDQGGREIMFERLVARLKKSQGHQKSPEKSLMEFATSLKAFEVYQDSPEKLNQGSFRRASEDVMRDRKVYKVFRK